MNFQEGDKMGRGYKIIGEEECKGWRETRDKRLRGILNRVYKD